MSSAVATRVPRADWLALAGRHRVLLATLFLIVFPVLMPFKAIAVNILIYGLFALGFNMLYGYARPAVVRPLPRCSAAAPTRAASLIDPLTARPGGSASIGFGRRPAMLLGRA